MLVESKARLNVPNKYRQTALHRAAIKGHTSSIRCLIDATSGGQRG